MHKSLQLASPRAEVCVAPEAGALKSGLVLQSTCGAGAWWLQRLFCSLLPKKGPQIHCYFVKHFPVFLMGDTVVSCNNCRSRSVGQRDLLREVLACFCSSSLKHTTVLVRREHTGTNNQPFWVAWRQLYTTSRSHNNSKHTTD
jgi:hypothetical protein